MEGRNVEPKAYAYVVRHDGHVLVFDHPNPEAGTQVPKGGVEADESPREAVRREVAEESGLTTVTVGDLLAVDRWPHPEKSKTYQRYFYRVIPSDPVPESWVHEVTGDGVDEGLVFEYYWVDPADASLVRDMDDYLDRL